MRYIAEYLESKSRIPNLGSSKRVVRNYSSPYNAKRYMAWHLRDNNYPPGQYRVSSWPEPGSNVQAEIVGYIYKTA